MNIFKKVLTIALSLCFTLGSVGALSGCEKEEAQTPPPPAVPQTVDFTITVKDDKGGAVAGAKFVMWANLDNSKVGDLETSADGKASVNVVVGEYDLELDSTTLPEMHLADQYKWTLDISESVNSLEVVLTDVSPDGSQEKPYYFIVNDEGEASVTLPANATSYYELRNISGASLFIQTQGVDVVYKGSTYSYNTEKGFVEVPLDKTGTNSRVKFALVNKTNAELRIDGYLRAPEGSLENPITLTSLGEISVEVSGTDVVYYKWTATATGTLTITSLSEYASLSVKNETNGGETVNSVRESGQTGIQPMEISVSANDVIIIEVSAYGAQEGQAYTYAFVAQLQTANE